MLWQIASHPCQGLSLFWPFTPNKVLKILGLAANLSHFDLLLFFPSLKEIDPLTAGGELCPKSSAQSCYVDISSLLCARHYWDSQWGPHGKEKVSREMSSQHMWRRASRCDMSASTTINDKVGRLTEWGFIDWQAQGVSKNIASGERKKLISSIKPVRLIEDLQFMCKFQQQHEVSVCAQQTHSSSAHENSRHLRDV